MATTPTQRSLQECRKRGYHAHVVEKWIPQVKRRIDLFGFIDIVALDGQTGVLGIQATATSGMSARVSKIMQSEFLDPWIEAGNRLEVWGWAKRGPAGKRKLWTLRVVDIKELWNQSAAG